MLLKRAQGCFRTNKPALRYAPRCQSRHPPPSCRRSGSAGASGGHTRGNRRELGWKRPLRSPSPTTTEPHHVKHSTALSATTNLPLNTCRVGDSPAPRAAHSRQSLEAPRSPQRAAPWLPESPAGPGRRGRPSPLAGALSPGQQGRGRRAAPAPP